MLNLRRLLRRALNQGVKIRGTRPGNEQDDGGNGYETKKCAASIFRYSYKDHIVGRNYERNKTMIIMGRKMILSAHPDQNVDLFFLTHNLMSEATLA